MSACSPQAVFLFVCELVACEMKHINVSAIYIISLIRKGFAYTVFQLIRTCGDWCVGSEFDEECNEMYDAMWFVRCRELTATSTRTVQPDRAECVHISVCIQFDHASWMFRDDTYASLTVYTLRTYGVFDSCNCWTCVYMTLQNNHTTTACVLNVRDRCEHVCIIQFYVNWPPCVVHTIWVYMNVAGIPAEFKHIDKRRRSYNIEYCQSLRMNTVYIIVEIADSFIEMLHLMCCQWCGGCIRFATPSEWGW
jgi:hypothetical protein